MGNYVSISMMIQFKFSKGFYKKSLLFFSIYSKLTSGRGKLGERENKNEGLQGIKNLTKVKARLSWSIYFFNDTIIVIFKNYIQMHIKNK